MGCDDDELHSLHVLFLPYPRQGHINPIVQFAKRLHRHHKRLTTSLAAATSISNSTHAPPHVAVQPISDGFHDLRTREAAGIEAYLDRFRLVGPNSLADIIQNHRAAGRPVRCLVYDAMLPWALGVARGLGLAAAAFLTQPCAVDAVYYCVRRGWPLEEAAALPRLGAGDLPSFVAAPEYSPAHWRLLVEQFSEIEEVEWVFCNTFQELEFQEIKWMTKFMPLKTIGPLIPSMYLETPQGGDKNYGTDLFEPDRETCMNWLDTKQENAVIFVSFGSFTMLNPTQLEELALGLIKSGYFFVWVVRSSELNLLQKFMDEINEKGLLVKWCPQVEVLAHRAVGLFVTHCGWNSTLEAISLGKPMVAIPQWTDQPTNAKYVEDVWGVGARARVDDDGIVRSSAIESCIREVMEGEKSEGIKRNVRKWSELAKRAFEVEGSSYKNIDDFVVELVTR